MEYNKEKTMHRTPRPMHASDYDNRNDTIKKLRAKIKRLKKDSQNRTGKVLIACEESQVVTNITM